MRYKGIDTEIGSYSLALTVLNELFGLHSRRSPFYLQIYE